MQDQTNRPTRTANDRLSPTEAADYLGVRADYAARRLSYRIVYVKDVIPEGVTACLCATKELGLTPDVH
jgi:hypothetical protein